MNELMDRVLGFLPQRATLWTAVSLSLFMFIVRNVSNWVIKKIELPWMEEKNQQQRKALEQGEKSE